jgi:hypothetical protein
MALEADHPHPGRFCLTLERNHPESCSYKLAGKLWATLLAGPFSLLFRQMFKIPDILFAP